MQLATLDAGRPAHVSRLIANRGVPRKARFEGGDRNAGIQVDLGRFALNDRFQMAFSYTLTDGRSGVAIAAFNGEREQEDDSR